MTYWVKNTTFISQREAKDIIQWTETTTSLSQQLGECYRAERIKRRPQRCLIQLKSGSFTLIGYIQSLLFCLSVCFSHVRVCASMCSYVHLCAGAPRSQRTTIELLEPEFPVLVNCGSWRSHSGPVQEHQVLGHTGHLSSPKF